MSQGKLLAFTDINTHRPKQYSQYKNNKFTEFILLYILNLLLKISKFLTFSNNNLFYYLKCYVKQNAQLSPKHFNQKCSNSLSVA